jgi:predicted GNAT superfamily acetyltransferase
VELHQAAEIPGADTWIGKMEFQRGLADWLAGFERGFRYEMTELIDCGRLVFARLAMHGRGRGSGAEIERDVFNVWEVRDGLGFRCRVFWDENEARVAAGLDPE